MKEYLSTLGMLNINPDKFVKQMAANVENYNLEKLLQQTQKPVLLVDEHEVNDYLTLLKNKKNINYEIWDTDIAFSNKRTALTRRLRDFLDTKINPANPIKSKYNN